MFTGFKGGYLNTEFCLYNDSTQFNRGLIPSETGEATNEVILAKLKRFDFENALRDVENWRLERLTDFLLELPVFSTWSRK
jgi:hypothetical protein